MLHSNCSNYLSKVGRVKEVKKEKILFYFILVCICFTFISPVSADVYYAYPPTVYVQPDPSYQTGQAIGTILGALIRGAQNQETSKNLAIVREKLKKVAIDEANGFASLVSEQGIDNTARILNSFASDKNFMHNDNFASDAYYFRMIQPLEDGTGFVYEYAIKYRYNECEVKVSYPPANIVESAYAKYTSNGSPNSTQTQSSNTEVDFTAFATSKPLAYEGNQHLEETTTQNLEQPKPTTPKTQQHTEEYAPKNPEATKKSGVEPGALYGASSNIYGNQNKSAVIKSLSPEELSLQLKLQNQIEQFCKEEVSFWGRRAWEIGYVKTVDEIKNEQESKGFNCEIIDESFTERYKLVCKKDLPFGNKKITAIHTYEFMAASGNSYPGSIKVIVEVPELIIREFSRDSWYK